MVELLDRKRAVELLTSQLVNTSSATLHPELGDLLDRRRSQCNTTAELWHWIRRMRGIYKGCRRLRQTLIAWRPVMTSMIWNKCVIIVRTRGNGDNKYS